MSKKCSQCNGIFSLVSRRYYCCDPNSNVCILCRHKKCPLCQDIRKRQYIPPKCSNCYISYNAKTQDQLFYQHICDKYFCSKCLIKVKSYEGNIALPCGHKIPTSDYDNFMSKFCIFCAKGQDNISDYQLLNGRIVCSSCFIFKKNQIREFLLSCAGCDRLLKNFNEVAIDNDAKQAGFLLCKTCFKASEIVQNNIQSQRQRGERNARYQNNQEIERKEALLKNNFVEKVEIPATQKKKSSDQINQKKPQFIKLQCKEIEEVEIKEENIEIESNKKNQQLNNSYMKSEKQVDSTKNQDSETGKLSISSEKNKVANGFQQNQSKVHQKSQLKQMKISQMKETNLQKHFSTDANLQDVKLTIQPQNLQKIVECVSCLYKIQIDVAVKSKNQENQYFCIICNITKNKIYQKELNSSLTIKRRNQLVAERKRQQSAYKKNPLYTSSHQGDNRSLFSLQATQLKLKKQPSTEKKAQKNIYSTNYSYSKNKKEDIFGNVNMYPANFLEKYQRKCQNCHKIIRQYCIKQGKHVCYDCYKR